MMYHGKMVEVLEQHTRSDGVLMLLVSWHDVYSGRVMIGVRADEVST